MTNIREELTRNEDVEALLVNIPYAQYLGLHAELKGDELTILLPFKEHIIGNRNIPTLHGGVIAGLLETTAILQLTAQIEGETLPKPVDVTIDYFRAGLSFDTFARAEVIKKGRRIASVYVTAWQQHRDRPIAALHGNFLLSPKEEG